MMAQAVENTAAMPKSPTSNCPNDRADATVEHQAGPDVITPPLASGNAGSSRCPPIDWPNYLINVTTSLDTQAVAMALPKSTGNAASVPDLWSVRGFFALRWGTSKFMPRGRGDFPKAFYAFSALSMVGMLHLTFEKALLAEPAVGAPNIGVMFSLAGISGTIEQSPNIPTIFAIEQTTTTGGINGMKVVPIVEGPS